MICYLHVYNNCYILYLLACIRYNKLSSDVLKYTDNVLQQVGSNLAAREPIEPDNCV